MKTKLITINKPSDSDDEDDDAYVETLVTHLTKTTSINFDNSEEDQTETPQTNIATPSNEGTSSQPQQIRIQPSRNVDNPFKKKSSQASTPDIPKRPRRSARKGTHSHLADKAKELAGMCTDDYFNYVENNKPSRRMEQIFYSLGFGDEPLSLKEAQQRDDWVEWYKAMEVDFCALLERGHFNMCHLVKYQKARKSLNADGHIKGNLIDIRVDLLLKDLCNHPSIMEKAMHLFVD